MSPQTPYQPIDILLVQADHAQAEHALAELRRANVLNEVRLVPNAREAVRFLRREGPYQDAPVPDFILFDSALPASEAQVLAYELDHEQTPHELRVIVLRDEDGADLPAGLRSAGRLEKPLDFNQFVRMVRQWSDLWLAVVKGPPPQRAEPAPAEEAPAESSGPTARLAADDGSDEDLDTMMQHRVLSNEAGARMTQFKVGDHVCVEIDESWLVGQLEIDQVGAALNRLVDNLEAPWLVIDFGKVDHMGSIMLGKLVALNRRLDEMGGQLRVVNLNEDMRKIFNVTHLDGRIQVCESLAEATGA